MPETGNQSTTNRRWFLTTLAAAIPAAALATGTAVTLAAAAEADPIYTAIKAHQAAVAAYKAADRACTEALERVPERLHDFANFRDGAPRPILECSGGTESQRDSSRRFQIDSNEALAKRIQAAVAKGDLCNPGSVWDDLGYYGPEPRISNDPSDPWYRVLRQPLVHGEEDRAPMAGDVKLDVCLFYNYEHHGIDSQADRGFMYRGERERLHAVLDANYWRREVIARLERTACEALEVEQGAAWDLRETKPTTMAGAIALGARPVSVSVGRV
jgi:hypothetical protein